MSRLSDEVQLAVSAAEAKRASAAAVSQIGWRNEVTDAGIVAKPGMGLTKWPSKLTVTASDSAGGGSAVDIDGWIFGFGPVQKKHLRGDIATLRAAIEQQATTG
jgi:hypothetical protein